MESSAIKTLLKLTDEPAFVLRNGVILYADPEPAALGLRVGTALSECLPDVDLSAVGETGVEIPVLLDKRQWILRAMRVEDLSFCVLRPFKSSFPAPNEQTLFRTAGTIRSVLQDLLVALDGMEDTVCAVPESARHAALALRGVYRLRHMAGNLELLASLGTGEFQLSRRDRHPVEAARSLCMELDELLRPNGCRLKWELPRQEISCYLDWPLISTLLRELIINAAADASDGQILLRLSRIEKNRLCFSVRNKPRVPLPDAPFHRHATAQADLLEGAGLGLSLVSAGAACHGGGLLLSTDERGTVTALLTLQTIDVADETIRSTVQLPQEPDANLIALSQILPVDFFRLEDLL